MLKKEAGLANEEAILKGKQGYRVVWEEEEEVTPVEIKDTVNIKTQESNNESVVEHKKDKIHPIHKHQHSNEYIIGILGFIVLVFLFFVEQILFWIFLWIFFFILIFVWLYRKFKTAYVDKMQQNVVYLKIKNPILTGFEIALGIGLFAAICILIGLVILLIFVVGAGYGIWSIVSSVFSI